ncbi:MAG TPA: hypothetical protein VN554_02510 [Verrucomicrobiae bacterium]|nr:hypothetical protein [Verrucomicrobiae bacterium]
MANALSTSLELSGEATKAAAHGAGRLAREVSGGVVQRMWPGVYISPAVRRQQDYLRRFEGRLAVSGDLMDTDGGPKDDGELEARAASTVQTLVDVGVVDPDTAIELRPVLPEDAVEDPAVNSRRDRVLELLGNTLAADYDVTSVPFSEPITPSAHRDSPIDVTATWGAITSELRNLSNQLHDGIHRSPAMLALTGTPYSQAIHEAWAGESRHVDHYGVVVLQRVGTLPEDNLLVPAAAA